MLLVVGVLWAIAFPIASLLLGIIAFLQRHTLRPTRADRFPLLVTSCFLIFGFNILTSLGQTLTDASNAAIIAYTMPVMTAVLSAIYLREHLDRRMLAAIALGTLGVVALVSHDIPALLSNPTGPLVMLLAALSWSVGNIAIKSHPWALAPAAQAAWTFALAIAPTWVLVWLTETPLVIKLPSVTTMAALAFHILGPMVTCYLLWAVLLSRLPPTVAAISVLTAPVVAVASATMLLGEELTVLKLISLALIVVSIFITLRRQ